MANRADNNDGSCREILTGKHKGKWRVQHILYFPDGTQKRISKLFRTKTEGKEYLRSLVRGDKQVDVQSNREMTLGDWFDWLVENDWPESLAEVTIEQRKRRFRKYVAKQFGELPLSKIDPLKVRMFYKTLRENGASESLVASVKADLVRAFNLAVSPYGKVPVTIANPFRLTIPAPRLRTAVALNPDQVRVAVHSPNIELPQRAMLAVLLLAGLRLGEMMALTKRQLKFEDDQILIDQAVRVEFCGKQSVGLPKGKKIRHAVMCNALKSILREYTKNMSDDMFLWSAQNENQPRMKKRIYDTWRSIIKTTGLPSDMSPHDCRLTHINIIEKLMPEVSATTLKEHVGHSAEGVTQVSYTRPLNSAQIILRDALGCVFRL
ncbi:MAG: tyrosine-type recombinase/integrase [Armatimonadota bacterium]